MRKRIVAVSVLFSFTMVALMMSAIHAETKYLKKAEVSKTMMSWNKALGVKCNFCHTKKFSQSYKTLAGQTVEEKDLKALVHKRIARAMLATTLYLNKIEKKEYSCKSCHQGKAEVEQK